MTNEEINKIVIRAEHEYERMKDTIHEQYEEKEELYEWIFKLKDDKYRLEDTIENIIQELIHSNITLGEMEKVGKLYE